MSKGRFLWVVLAALAVSFSGLWMSVAGQGHGMAVAVAQEHEADDGHHEARFGSHSRGFLGVSLTPMTEELRRHFGAPEGAGVLISKVGASTPAEAAGLQVGDVLTAVEGEEIGSPGRLRRLIAGKSEGDVVTLEVYRDGRLEQLSATLSERQTRGRLIFDDPEQFGEILKRLQESFGGAEIGEHIRESFEGVEWDQIGRSVEEALEGIDWEAFEGIDWEAIAKSVEEAGDGVEVHGLSDTIREAIKRAMEAVHDIDIHVHLDHDEDPQGTP